MSAVISSIRAAEAIIAVVDAADEPHEALAMFQPGPDWNGPPMAVLLNKADLVKPQQLEELTTWYKTNCRAEEVGHTGGEGQGKISALECPVVVGARLR
jgi:GTP-binding protein Era